MQAAPDSLLDAVNGLRAALPPEKARGNELAPDKNGRAIALKAIVTLQSALKASSTLALHPIQAEVIFRQLGHTLYVLTVWGASGTTEEALDATLGSLDALLRCSVLDSMDMAKIMCAPLLRATTGQVISTLLDIAGWLGQLSGIRRAACVRGIRRICELPSMDQQVLAFFLPGVVSRLASLGTDDEKSSTPLLVELLRAVESIVLGCATDKANASCLNGGNLSSSPKAWVRALHAQVTSRRQDGGDTTSQPNMNQMTTEQGQQSNHGITAAASTPSTSELIVVRTTGWLEDSAQRMVPLLIRLCAAAAGRGWRARLQVVLMSRALLLQCALSLRACVPPLLGECLSKLRPRWPTLPAQFCLTHIASSMLNYHARQSASHANLSARPFVSLLRLVLSRRYRGVFAEQVYGSTRDPYPQVAHLASATLQDVGKRLASSVVLGELVREGLERQIRSLPLVMHSVDESAKARAFAVLSAQLELLYASGEFLDAMNDSNRTVARRWPRH